MGVHVLIGQERTVETNKQFRVRPNAWVDVSGKYGNIHVATREGDQVSVNVKVHVRADDMEDVERMLEKIDVRVEGDENRVSVSSSMDDIAQWNSYGGDRRGGRIRITFKDGTKVRLEEFAIDYELTIPRSNNVELNNKYGNIYLGDLRGDANISLKYGNIETESLGGRTTMILGYGKAEMETIDWGDFEVKYSELDLETAKALRLESKYSNFEIGEADTLLSASKYNDYEFGKVEYIIAEERNSEMNIETLRTFGAFDMRYGKLEIEELANTFEVLRFEGEYTDCRITLEDGANCSMDVSSKYANISYPRGMDIRQDIKDHSSRKLVGQYGRRGAQSRIQVTTSYGDVTIDADD